MARTFHVYILASKRNGTLYTGVTGDLLSRVHQHKQNLVDGFTKKYGVHMLVYVEQYSDPETAIAREKTVKHWPRQKKLQAIEGMNPAWRDLAEDLTP